jgi:hypothetical protein
MKLASINSDGPASIASIIKQHVSKYRDDSEEHGFRSSVDGIPVIIGTIAMDDHPDKDHFLGGKAFKIGGNALGGSRVSINFMYDFAKLSSAPFPNLDKAIRYITYHEFEHPEGESAGPDAYHIAPHELRADANAIEKLGITTWDELEKVATHLPFDNDEWRSALNTMLQQPLL